MKYINAGDKHDEYNFFDDAVSYDETAKPRWIPSYYNVAKKHRGGFDETRPEKK